MSFTTNNKSATSLHVPKAVCSNQLTITVVGLLVSKVINPPHYWFALPTVGADLTATKRLLSLHPSNFFLQLTHRGPRAFQKSVGKGSV